MKITSRILVILNQLLLVLLFGSCSLIGIHIHVQNPKKPGKYPAFSPETILLGELTPIRKNFDVAYYDLDVTIDSKRKQLGGWVEIRAKALSDIDSIQIDLDQPLTIEELRWNSRIGERLNYTRKYRGVLIKLPQRVSKDEVFSVHVQYSGNPIVAKRPPWSGGLVWKKDKNNNNWIGVACESEGASIWFPCKDHTSDEADSVRMRFTIPDSNLFVAANGVFLASEKKNGMFSFNWKVHYPINTYDISFYVGNFSKIEDSLIGINNKKLRISHYVLTDNLEKATTHFQQVKDQIKGYEEIYGEYPWYQDGFKLIQSPYEGMEHQTAIAYGSRFKNDLYGKVDYIILHETGHEWFGNAVTASDFADVWLQEGITTYGEALYLEKKYGKEEALNHLLMYRIMIKNKLPIVGVRGRRYFDYHDGDVYVKSAWILHSLRTTINNDSLFFAIIKTFYSENKLKVTTTAQFIETTNRVAGKDYNWFFNQYLFQNKVPFFEFEYYSDGLVYYRWTDVVEGFNKVPVKIKFEGDEKEYEVFPDSKIQSFKREGSYKPAKMIRVGNNNALFGIKVNKKLRSMYFQ